MPGVGEDAVGSQLVAVASSMHDRLQAITDEVQFVIEEALPGLRADETRDLLVLSVAQNVDNAVCVLRDLADAKTVDAPAAALEYARILAHRDIPAVTLLRAYRIGEARFLRCAIEELLRQSPGSNVEARTALRVVEDVSEMIDRIVEQVLTVYEHERDGLVGDRSAVLATRVREILRGDHVDVDTAELALGYRLRQSHIGIVAWVNEAGSLDAVRRFVEALADAVGAPEQPLFVPADEMSGFAWVPSKTSVAGSKALRAVLDAEPRICLAVGEPAAGVAGFRRTHQQALTARSVALAAGPSNARVTPFLEVAPIAMLCADLDSARAWVGETLGDLAIDSTRNEGLRETARVFLRTGGSYTATAEQLFLHRNTAQYRVRKAEEMRGRPFREARLDVELALLACHWLGPAVLTPSPDSPSSRPGAVAAPR